MVGKYSWHNNKIPPFFWKKRMEVVWFEPYKIYALRVKHRVRVEFEGIPSEVESFFHKDDTNDNSNDNRQWLEQGNEERAFLPNAPSSNIEPACYVNNSLQWKFM